MLMIQRKVWCLQDAFEHFYKRGLVRTSSIVVRPALLPHELVQANGLPPARPSKTTRGSPLRSLIQIVAQ